MKRLARDRSGAVYVEFLIAFLPLFIFFMCLVQMAGLHTGRLATLHAAEIGVRAAIVVLPDDPSKYGNTAVNQIQGDRKDAVFKAVSLAVSPVRSIIGLKVTYPSSAGGDDDQSQVGRNDLIRVKVEALYKCSIPLAKNLVCSPGSATRKLKAEAALPNQGADYSYE